MGFTFMPAIIFQGWVNMENKSFLTKLSHVRDAVICIIELLLSEYQAANKPKPQIKLIKKVENKRS